MMDPKMMAGLGGMAGGGMGTAGGGGLDPKAAKLKLLMELLEYATGGMAHDAAGIKSRHAEAGDFAGEPDGGYTDDDGSDTGKDSLSADGQPEGSPELLLKDLDQDAIMKLLGKKL